MKIAIVGGGNVGQALGRLSREAGHEVGPVVCRSKRAAVRAVEFIGGGVPQSSSQPLASPVGLILISTPDDQISSAAQAVLSSANRLGRPVVLHTSGALGSDVLDSLKDSGLDTGSCHPLQSFRSPEQAVAVARRSYFCIEGSPRAVRIARRFVRDIGGVPFAIRADTKPLYHAAAVLASGGLTSLLSISLELMTRCGLGPKEASRVLLPLAEGTVSSVREAGPVGALTGPIRRGDAGTVESNLKALEAVDGRWAEVYRALGLRSLDLAEQANPGLANRAELRRLLGKRRKRRA